MRYFSSRTGFRGLSIRGMGRKGAFGAGNSWLAPRDRSVRNAARGSSATRRHRRPVQGSDLRSNNGRRDWRECKAAECRTSSRDQKASTRWQLVEMDRVAVVAVQALTRQCRRKPACRRPRSRGCPAADVGEVVCPGVDELHDVIGAAGVRACSRTGPPDRSMFPVEERVSLVMVTKVSAGPASVVASENLLKSACGWAPRPVVVNRATSCRPATNG